MKENSEAVSVRPIESMDQDNRGDQGEGDKKTTRRKRDILATKKTFQPR